MTSNDLRRFWSFYHYLWDSYFKFFQYFYHQNATWRRSSFFPMVKKFQLWESKFGVKLLKENFPINIIYFVFGFFSCKKRRPFGLDNFKFISWRTFKKRYAWSFGRNSTKNILSFQVFFAIGYFLVAIFFWESKYLKGEFLVYPKLLKTLKWITYHTIEKT